MSGAETVCQTVRDITFPNSNIVCSGASDLSDASLTDHSLLLFTFNTYERSRIMRNFLDLCDIAAMGEIFRFDGVVFDGVPRDLVA